MIFPWNENRDLKKQDSTEGEDEIYGWSKKVVAFQVLLDSSYRETE